MQRRRMMLLGLGLAAATALPSEPARAETSGYTRQVEQELRRQGFTSMDVSHTWLGRVRIEARSTTEKREIVLNPHTGEILRDYTTGLKGQSASESILGGNESGSGRGSSGAGSGGDHAGSSSGGNGSSGSDGSSGDGGHSGDSGSSSDGGSGSDGGKSD